MASQANSPTVLITGAASPVGRAAAELFLARGWQVLAVDAEQPDPALPDGARFFAADLAIAGELDALCDEVQATLAAGLNALINAPAPGDAKALLDTSLADWDRMQALNLRAPALLARNLYSALKTASGAVVNVASGAGRTSRGGLLALTRAMSIEFAGDGLRANLVQAAPEMAPAEVAKAIYFLADGEQSGSITGQSLVVDGGASARLAIE